MIDTDKLDYYLISYWGYVLLYAIILGVCYVALYIEFSWKLAMVSWVISLLLGFFSYKLTRRIEYRTEKRVLAEISEKLREVKR